MGALSRLVALLTLLVGADAWVKFNRCKCETKYGIYKYWGATNDGGKNFRFWCYLASPKWWEWKWDYVFTDSVPRQKTKSGKTCRDTSHFGVSFMGCADRSHHSPWCYLDGTPGMVGSAWEECRGCSMSGREEIEMDAGIDWSVLGVTVGVVALATSAVVLVFLAGYKLMLQKQTAVDVEEETPLVVA